MSNASQLSKAPLACPEFSPMDADFQERPDDADGDARCKVILTGASGCWMEMGEKTGKDGWLQNLMEGSLGSMQGSVIGDYMGREWIPIFQQKV